ncbi:DNA cytosine methyltransferase [uncultured Thiohalocapsa sp.]|uniref:DNA cytosine methyltransferase n=1 Tax=uncultured Thiohalocapsa sp. TaxID=768990 RepID=UPI0025EA1EC7|nr:DNA cytosine methyltransferase [uncultured Thiohalocapsa sp.]
MRPIGVDLFAGAGGLSLGFEQAGFDVVGAVDIDPIHCAVHSYNFPTTIAIPRSVETLTGQSLRELTGIGSREIDCVFGGAPCQGFSLIGHRLLNDPRNKLVLHFVRLVYELKPRRIVFENVKGLTVGRHKAFLRELVTAFEEAGYELRLPWRVLNAAHYGTPQFRERLFLLGTRKGEPLPKYPAATTSIAERIGERSFLPNCPTCADALQDLPDADLYQTLLTSDAVRTIRFGTPSQYAAQLRCITGDAWHYGVKRDWNRELLTASARTEHTRISRQRFRETKPGTVEPISRFYKLDAEGVSNTLRAGTDGARGAFTSPRPIHYNYSRCITVREMARLHGFPDWFRFHVTKWHGARQIGNAVPPPLARAIANSVISTLGVDVTTNGQAIQLGESELLRLDASSAAARFGVERLPNRRDQKSGARKRKQEDIERERIGTKVSHGGIR